MDACYTLKILSEFASAHTLRGYPGACQRMHGHNWKVEVEVQASELDELGMAVDFKRIKQAAR
ncbi:MAG TPA: 6-carboxytetrahydropterin synthase, partial [Gammaproteobacteria bacterium]|nr:6-carboxytetrahydropterin synthase [Gammaproteobacteria bacterium]